MTHPRPFRFGAKLRYADHAASWSEQARRAEELGYSSALLPDHFVGPQLGPLVAATAAACATSQLRVGTSVLSNDFRHPAVLAKEIASLDVLSGGRVELGLGAGWMRSEYEQTGLVFDRPGVRIERLEEALEILKQCFKGGPVDFDGRHYRLKGLEPSPIPTQRPHPPLLVGGGGRRILSLAAREADIVGINPAARSGAHDAATDRDGSAQAADEKVAWVREAAGARWDRIELCMQVYLAAVTEDRDEADRQLRSRYDFPIEAARQVPYALAGSIESICDALEARRERWHVSYWIVPTPSLETLAPVVARLSGR